MQTQRQFSEHAVLRMAQRHLNATEIEYVILNGRRIYNAGTLFCFLGKQDIPKNERSKFARLEGTTVLLDADQAEYVITVYRNRSALKQIRRKLKCNLKHSLKPNRMRAMALAE